jgi:glycosyltransferase involved in cell wall biosynthesis
VSGGDFPDGPGEVQRDLEQKGLTVVIPVHNEAETIETTVRELDQKILKRIRASSLIVVEDGSTDGTRGILERLQVEIPFALMSALERRTFAGAFRVAMAAPKSEFIFFCDSDGQYDPGDFFSLLRELPESDVVSGYKRVRHDPFYRVLLSAGLNGCVRLLFGFFVRDIDSSFKLIRRRVIDDVLGTMNFDTPCPMVEFMLRARQKGYRIKEVPIGHRMRGEGASRIFRARSLPGMIVQMLIGLFRIRFRAMKNF